MKSVMMGSQQIWIEQCEAAEGILDHFGIESALDYVICVNLFSFVAHAEQTPEFAEELPDFVAAIRRLFTARDIRAYLARLERGKFLSTQDAESGSSVDEQRSENEPHCPVFGAQEILRFARIKELLQGGM